MSQPYGSQQSGPQPGFDNRHDAGAQAAAEKAYRRAQRPWFQKKRFVIPMVIFGLFILGRISSSGQSESSSVAAVDTPEAQTAPVAPSAPIRSSRTAPAFPGATENDTVARAGEAVNKDGLIVTTTPIKKGDSTFGKTLCSKMTYQNNQNESVSFNAFDWKLQDPNGTILTTSFGGTDDTLDSGDLAPGGRVSGDVCFDNKSGASGLYVVLYDSSIFSSDRIAWLNKI